MFNIDLNSSDLREIKRNIKKEIYPKYNSKDAEKTTLLPAYSLNDKENISEPTKATRTVDFHLQIKEEAFESNDLLIAAYDILQQLFQSNLMVYTTLDKLASNFANVNPAYYVNVNGSVKGLKYLKENVEEILNYPNNYETGYELRKKTGLSLANFGNAYWQIRKSKANSLHSFHFLPADSIRVVPFLNTETDNIDFAYIQLDETLQTIEKTFFDDEIVHFKMPNHFNYVYGFPPILAAIKELTFDEESKKWLSSFFTKAFSAGVIFSMPNSTKDLVKRNRSQIQNHFSGGQNFGKAMILEGEAKVVNDGNKLKDGFPLIELKETLMNLFMPALGLPLSVAGIQTSKVKGNNDSIYSDEQAHLRALADYSNVFTSTLNLKIFRNPYIMPKEYIGKITVQLGLNNTFSRKYASETVKTAAEYAIKMNDAQQMLGLPKFDDSEIGEMYITKTNNGIVPLANIIKFMPEKLELQNEKMKVDLEQAKKDLTNNTTDTTPNSETNSIDDLEDDSMSTESSLSVSFEQADTTFD